MDLPSFCAAALGVGRAPSPRRLAAGLACVFAVAFAVRALYAVDLAGVMYTARQPGTRMAWRYDDTAVAIRGGEGVLWPRQPDPARTGLLSRPPGYGLYLAGVYAALGRSFFAAQLVQDLATSASCVVLALLALRLVSFRVGIAGGLVAAVSPHLAYTSNFVLPDSLSALPLLLGMFALVSADRDRPGAWRASLVAGTLFGATAWLRPNALLLPPFVAIVLLAVARSRRRAARHALLVVAAAAAVIAPITVRNYLLTGELVPISINGGLTLWHGVTDVGGFSAGARRRDQLVMDEEAARYGNPRYREWWAEPDGIRRDRDRFRRSLAVLGAHPGSFLRVMLGRMGQMLDYADGGPALVEPWPGAVLAEAAARGAPPEAAGEGSEPGDARSHDLARTPRDGRFLAAGQAVSPLRLGLRPLQQGLLRVLTPLAGLGVLGLLLVDWRRSVLLLTLPLYFLTTYSPFLYEWRVAVPMHYPLCAAGAAGALVLAAALRRALRQNQAGEQVPR